MSELKPKMPKYPPELHLKDHMNWSKKFATLLCDSERFSSGSLLMRIEDTKADIIDTDEGKIGEVCMAIGASLYVYIGERLWAIDKLALFELMQKLEKEQYLETENGSETDQSEETSVGDRDDVDDRE